MRDDQADLIAQGLADVLRRRGMGSGEPVPEEWVSVSEYARRRRCSRHAVEKAIAQGRIVQGVRKEANGWWSVQPAVADGEWLAGTMPRKDVELAGHAGPEPGSPSAPEDTGRRTPADLVHARAKVEEARAGLEELKLAAMRGDMVSGADVKRTWYAIGRQMREALLPIGERISDELAAESDPVQIAIRWEIEVTRALEGLCSDWKAEE